MTEYEFMECRIGDLVAYEEDGFGRLEMATGDRCLGVVTGERQVRSRGATRRERTWRILDVHFHDGWSREFYPFEAGPLTLLSRSRESSHNSCRDPEACKRIKPVLQ